jgi:hypothetical protein
MPLLACLLVFLVTMSSGLFDVGVEGKGLEYPCGTIIYVTVYEVRFSFVLIASFFIVQIWDSGWFVFCENGATQAIVFDWLLNRLWDDQHGAAEKLCK